MQYFVGAAIAFQHRATLKPQGILSESCCSPPTCSHSGLPCYTAARTRAGTSAVTTRFEQSVATQNIACWRPADSMLLGRATVVMPTVGYNSGCCTSSNTNQPSQGWSNISSSCLLFYFPSKLDF